MSLELGKELRLRTFDRGAAFDEHCVDTTPAGAVFLAVTALVPAGGFDLVVSGINRGANVGDVSHGSGTVGGAMAAAFHGIPSVAASLGATARDFDYAAGFVAGFAARLLESAPDANVVFSINIPNETRDETRGVVVAPMGGSYLEIGYDEVESDDGARVFRPRFDRPRPYPAGSDSQAFADDMITITPLAFDWTAHDAIESVRRWDLSP